MATTGVTRAATKDNETKTLLLGRYELGKLLGHGTFAKVYQAKNVATDENVAIKMIDKEKINRVGLNSHIKREISILRRVRHPNIVRLFEVMATKSKIFFVMELVNGGELFDRVVAKGRLKENAARRYFQQIISAVALCHEHGVYHRDLKPENVLVDEQGNVKVADFGLSTVAEEIINKDGLSHTFCGTPAYVAPEVLANRGYDAAKVDAWSCGVVLFVLVAGYFPFHDKNVMNMYRKICKGEFKCPKWFSSDLIGLLTRLLDINPVTRITIPEVMNDVWFRKGFKQVRFYFEDDKLCNVIDVEINDKNTFLLSDDHQSIDDHNLLLRPHSLNAFDIISFSSGFDLSGLFQEGSDGGSRFISTDATVSNIITKLDEITSVVGFTVRKKDCRVSMEGFREGSKGPLIIKVEIFELTPCLRVLEVRKKSGDRLDFDEFCEREVKPRLECLVLANASNVDVAAN